jgi:hypothetical protein
MEIIKAADISRRICTFSVTAHTHACIHVAHGYPVDEILGV